MDSCGVKAEPVHAARSLLLPVMFTSRTRRATSAQRVLDVISVARVICLRNYPMNCAQGAPASGKKTVAHVGDARSALSSVALARVAVRPFVVAGVYANGSTKPSKKPRIMSKYSLVQSEFFP